MQDNIKLTVFIVACSVIGQLAAEVVAPSLPFIEREFMVSQALSSLTISYFMFGMALPLVAFGVLADKFNRKKIILISSYIGLLGSIGCVVAPNIYILIMSRLLQGVGFSGMYGISTVILKDKFSGVEFAKQMAYLGVAFSLTIDLAPFIGGFLQTWFSFRVIFFMVLLINLLVLYLAHAYNDNYVGNNSPFEIKSIAIKFVHIITNRNLFIFTMVSSVQYAIMMVYIILGTFIIQEIFLRSPIFYGTTAIFLSIIFALFSILNGKLLNKVSIISLIIAGLILNLFSGALLLVGYSILGANNVYYFIMAVIPMFIGLAFVFSNTSSLIFSDIEQDTGLAYTISATIRFTIGFMVTWVAGLVDNLHEIIVLGGTFIVLSLVGVCFMLFSNRATKFIK